MSLADYQRDQDAPLAIHLGTYTPIAAKEYACNICGLKIEIGEKYKKRVFKCEGKIETFRMHLDQPCLNEYE